MFHTRHFVLKICETIWTGIRSNYSNTRILFGVPKNPNTEYQILFGIEKIRIPNTNTTFRSNYSNSIQIQNYSSHTGLRPNQILQCAASLAAGSNDRPCGPIESLFLWSLARILDGRAQLYSSESLYSYCRDHHLNSLIIQLRVVLHQCCNKYLI